MHVLGIDPGLNHAGFYCDPGQGTTLHLNQLDQFDALGVLHDFVTGVLCAYRHDRLLIVCENPVQPRYGSGVKTLLAQGCIRSAVKQAAVCHHHHGIGWVDVAPSSLKKFATGNHQADKRAVHTAALDEGGKVGSEHEADAYWCWRIGQLYLVPDDDTGWADALAMATTVMPEMMEV